MRNEKSLVRDEDIPAVLFLLSQIQHDYFEKDFDTVSGEEIEYYVDDMNLFNEETKSMSAKTVSNIFSLQKSDTGYRPKKENIERMLSFHLKIPTSLELFTMEKEERIESYFSILDDYVVLTKNPRPGTVVRKDIQPISLGGGSISIDLSQGAVAQIIDTVAPIVGDLLSNKLRETTSQVQYSPKTRVEMRIGLREERRQDNIDKILKKTISFAQAVTATEEEIDLDWLVEFFNLAQDCSNERLQYVWAKLLLDEVREPGGISRRTLGLLKLITPQEARSFHALCQCVWTLSESHFGSERMLIKDIDDEGRYSDYHWGFDGAFISHLEESGLITDSQLQLDNRRVYVAEFFGERFELKTEETERDLYVVALTRAGEDLFRVIQPEPNHEYKKATLEYFRSIRILK